MSLIFHLYTDYSKRSLCITKLSCASARVLNVFIRSRISTEVYNGHWSVTNDHSAHTKFNRDALIASNHLKNGQRQFQRSTSTRWRHFITAKIKKKKSRRMSFCIRMRLCIWHSFDRITSAVALIRAISNYTVSLASKCHVTKSW